MSSPEKHIYVREVPNGVPFEMPFAAADTAQTESDDGYHGSTAVVDNLVLALPYYVCPYRAIAPELKNSSDASLISSNSDHHYSSEPTIESGSLPDKVVKFELGFADDESMACHIPAFDETRLESAPDEESAWIGLSQFAIPFVMAGLGNVAAGIVLDRVQHWHVFKEIPQLLILVPALLGFKGNVEMTLASRLSTHAFLGQMDTRSELKSMVIGNMALVQCQACGVGFIAPIVAIVLSMTSESEGTVIGFRKFVLVLSSSVITANVANLIMGTLMCFVVAFSRKVHINPDNIATPIAAAGGDFVSLILLAYVSQGLLDSDQWLAALLLVLLLMLSPVWAVIAKRNKYTKHVLYSGWYPIFGAMLIQNAGGLIMENALARFDKMASFQPVINGVGGNLSAMQSSRISTYLHRGQTKRTPYDENKLRISPVSVFFGKNPHALMARLLFLIATPGHLIFITAIRIIKDNFAFTVLFVVFYLSAALIQIAIVLVLSYYLVHILWRYGIDPDNSAIPFLTALADLLGSALLLLAFFLLKCLNDPNAISD